MMELRNYEIDLSDSEIIKVTIYNPFPEFFPYLKNDKVEVFIQNTDKCLVFTENIIAVNDETIPFLIKIFEVEANNKRLRIPFFIIGATDIVSSIFDEQIEWMRSQMLLLKEKYFLIKESDFREQKFLFQNNYGINYDVISDEKFLNFVLDRIPEFRFDFTITELQKPRLQRLDKITLSWEKRDFSNELKIEIFHEYCIKVNQEFDNIFEKLNPASQNDYIIKQILRLGLEMEKFPESYLKMGENDFRNNFTTHLNLLNDKIFVSGETFNRYGKTDILVTNTNKEILFIGECKLWTGQGQIIPTVEQLFKRYATWRNNQVAIIIFNNSVGSFTEILEKARNELKTHPLFLEFVEERKENCSYSYIFKHPDDNKRKINTELIVFNFYGNKSK